MRIIYKGNFKIIFQKMVDKSISICYHGYTGLVKVRKITFYKEI